MLLRVRYPFDSDTKVPFDRQNKNTYEQIPMSSILTAPGLWMFSLEETIEWDQSSENRNWIGPRIVVHYWHELVTGSRLLETEFQKASRNFSWNQQTGSNLRK